MRDPFGYYIKEFPYDGENAKAVGVLFSHEFPSTIVFEDLVDGQPIIKEWVDSDERVNRYFTYKVSKGTLLAFIEGKISHNEMIMSCIDGAGILSDQNSGGFLHQFVVAPARLPIDYLPDLDVGFVADEAVDTDIIVEHFDLANVAAEISIGNLKEMADDEETDILNLHIRRGKGVGYGRIDSDTLAKSLASFNTLYKELTLDHVFGIPVSPEKTTARRISLDSMSTDVVLNKAASFSIFIRPKITDDVLRPDPVPSGIIPKNLYWLLETSHDETTLQENHFQFSDSVFEAYRDFLKTVSDSSLEIDLNWANNVTGPVITETVNSNIATKTIGFINSITQKSLRTLRITGKFTLINVSTKHFNFRDSNLLNFKGYFSPLLADAIDRLTFDQGYELTIERSVFKTAGRIDEGYKDLIVSVLPNENPN